MKTFTNRKAKGKREKIAANRSRKDRKHRVHPGQRPIIFDNRSKVFF